jgi:hypothetical protein
LTLRVPTSLLICLVAFTADVGERVELAEAARQATLFANGQQLMAQDAGDSTWRRTRLGWVDTRSWYHPQSVEYERRIELVHPIIFAALLVLFSVGALIWASEEYQWARLMHRRQ